MKNTQKSHIVPLTIILVVVIIVAAVLYVSLRESPGHDLQNMAQNYAAMAQESANVVISSPSETDVLQVGKTYSVVWSGEDKGHQFNYLVILQKIFGNTIKKVYLGSVSSGDETFAFTIPTSTAPGPDYQVYLDNSINGYAIAGSKAFTVTAVK